MALVGQGRIPGLVALLVLMVTSIVSTPAALADRT